jgi:signal transduction histidine kinase
MDYLEEVPKEIISETLSHSISLKHPLSMHGAVIRKGKPFFLRKIGAMEQEPGEYANTKHLAMRSVFVIPLKMDNTVFATLTFGDTKYQREERIKFLTKEERFELDLLSQYISPALYQALQKEQIQKAKDEIERAQAAVSRAKNEAAINQLAAHLAHEVNNPLNYIATGKTMQSDSFDKYHDMILGVLTSEDKDSLAFKGELEKLQEKFQRGLKQTDEGQDRIAKVIAEIRAITGVDGLNFSAFDIVPVINEELIYSLHRNKIQISEQAIKVTGTEKPIHVLSNTHITARAIRTIISNCIYFAREHKGFGGELYIDCIVRENTLFIDIGNNSFSIKNKNLDDLFDLEKSQAYGTEQIGLAMIKELLHKINCDLLLADHGGDSGRVNFQLRIPLEQAS